MNFNIPKVEYGLIGGSGTWGIRFPEDLKRKDVKVLEIYQGFDTPFGKSATFKLLEVKNHKVLRVATHGFTNDKNGGPLPIWICARQVAWVFNQASIKYALTDGSVGGIKSPMGVAEPLAPWSIIIPDDFIMNWMPPVDLEDLPRKPSARLRNPFCQILRHHLYETASTQSQYNVYNDGIYICTLSDRFETEAEIRMMAHFGANIVGQTLGHEAPLMRKYNIHFAALNIVSNVAEGYVRWIGQKEESMADFYHKCARPMANIIIDSLIKIIDQKQRKCDCENYQLTHLENFPVKGA